MNDAPSPEPSSASRALVIIHDSAINYAFQQNAIPVVKELRFQNDDVARKDLVIRVSTEPAFAALAEIRIQSIEPKGEFRVSPLDLKLGHDFLAGLNEKVAGWLKIEVVAGDEILCSRTEPVSLLARNEWCGLVALPEILAAFILPNDPALMPILGRASDLLREATGRGALNGYQDKSRKRAWEQVAALYKAVAELGIRYINPPASFENSGQKISFPSQIVAERFGTCLDLTLLFAASCERVGLHPLVLMHEGHAYAGCWLEERTFPDAAEDGADALQQIRKHETESLITVFETTLVAGESPGLLGDAERSARAHLHTEKPFRLALDVQRARISRIVPLPIPGQRTAGSATTTHGGPAASEIIEGIGDRIFLDPLNPLDPVGSAAAKPATRIDQWKSRLLDLSLRNRLLNFKETKSTIRILSAAPEHVEDELAAESELALRPKPKLMSEDDPRHGATLSRQQRADALAVHLADELKHGRLHTHLEESEHARRLTELFRAARNALDENGTNTLFAAVGLLEWRETEHSDRVYRAPLLLVPVELKRKSVLEGFSLRRIDEETRLNVTLMEMLRQNFQKNIDGLDPLPEDESGVNVGRVFQLFRDAVRDLPGWEVKTEVWLGQFSFTKFLLWKDLADRLDDLTRNRIVNHLVNEAGTPYDNPPDITSHGLDDRFHPRDVFCPRSADSSQLAAVMAAAAGHDFVLEGPPGTGKSQTITNIIAHCLAHGKRVLFVAEKRAALDVVHRRLREEGLEPFCLELHSNKIGKADVLAQFDRSLKFVTDQGAADWELRATELERLRANLNAYTRALHQRTPARLSAHDCFDYLLPRQNEPTVRLDHWPAILDTTAAQLDETRLLTRQLQERSRAVMPLHDHALAPLACEEWSPAWAERALDRVRELAARATAATDATRELRTWLRCPDASASRAHLHHLRALIESLLAPQPVGPAFATTPWNQLAPDLDLWTAHAAERAELRTKLRQVHTEFTAPQVYLPYEKWAEADFCDVLTAASSLKAVIHDLIKSAGLVPVWSVKLVHEVPPAAIQAAKERVPNRESQATPNRIDAKHMALVRRDHERFPHMLISLRRKLVSLLIAQSKIQPHGLRIRQDAEVRTDQVSCVDVRFSRSELHQLRELAERLLRPEPVEPQFFSEGWEELEAALDEWIAKVEERAELRTQLRRIHSPTADGPGAECEKWDSARLDEQLASARELASLTREASDATRALRAWFHAPRATATREELARLVALTDSLVGAAPVTESFVTTPWSEWVGRFDRWIAWVEERVELRAKLAGYDEAKLLALDLDTLKKKWDSGKNAWFLMRWLRLGYVCRQLRHARTDQIKPEESILGDVLSAALRLRFVNGELSIVRGDAEYLLGTAIWCAGEPDAVNLIKVRAWGTSLHEHLTALTGEDANWLAVLRRLIAGLFKNAPRSFGQEKTNIEHRLGLFRDSVGRFDESYDALAATAVLNRGEFDCSADHLGSVASALEIFMRSAPRMRELNADLASAGPKAQTTLGTLWADGEPVSQTLCVVRDWGATIHGLALDFTGGDEAGLARVRHIGAVILAERKKSMSQKSMTRALECFRDGVAKFDEAYQTLASTAALNRDEFDHAADHLAAVALALDTFIQSAPRLRAINSELTAAAPTAQPCLGVIWSKGEPSSEALAQARLWGEALHARMLACAGDDLVWLGQLRQLLATLFTEGPTAYAPGTGVGTRLTRYRDALAAFAAALEGFATDVKLRRPTVDDAPDHLPAVLTLTERLPAAWRHIREWCSWQKARRAAMDTGLKPVIAKLESAEGATLEVPGLFERSFRKALLFSLIEREPALREFFGREHNERIERFRELDEKMATLTREFIRSFLAAGIPRDQGNSKLPKAEISLLRKELGKKTRHIPVRRLLAGIPKLLPLLKPCVLMSPLSVAQYLEASHETFDVVIFDEASQIPVWDAIGAIARGKQLIVVGDPKQLPPTNFFSNAGNDDEDDLTPEAHKDLESVLDELMSHQVRHKRLQWHYRSRHEGLITFSNRQYYENDLLTFPSPDAGHGGVRFRHLPEARYDKGKTRTNLGEAKALVEELVARLRAIGGPRRSFGVVTFSMAQQQLVENLLDEQRRKHPDIEAHFGDEPPVEGEPVFVKNLENVQGDERDVIFFSICYGPDESGKVAMNFGPVNRDGGERRLNVAITRAKHEVLVFSGLRADQIDLTRTRARGVRDLKHFLDYADRGPKALAAATSASGAAEAESEFEKMVADRVRAAGFEVHHQVGCSGYRIDLAVVDPAAPGRYLFGIECDGATYHRAATARDRDKLRQMILEGLGWKLHRIWSTDWWHDADKEIEKLKDLITTATAAN